MSGHILAATNVAGIPTELLVPVLSAVLAYGASHLSNRQARRQSHDQVVLEREANLWKTLQADNEQLRREVDELEGRIDQLEAAMHVAGVPIPPR